MKKSFPLTVEGKNPDRLLKSEMYVRVDVLTEAKEAAESPVEIPAKAFFLRGEDYFVFLETAPGKFERRKVRVGTERDGKVPVLEGLSAGQRVVSETLLPLLQQQVTAIFERLPTTSASAAAPP